MVRAASLVTFILIPVTAGMADGAGFFVSVIGSGVRVESGAVDVCVGASVAGTVGFGVIVGVGVAGFGVTVGGGVSSGNTIGSGFSGLVRYSNCSLGTPCFKIHFT